MKYEYIKFEKLSDVILAIENKEGVYREYANGCFLEEVGKEFSFEHDYYRRVKLNCSETNESSSNRPKTFEEYREWFREKYNFSKLSNVDIHMRAEPIWNAAAEATRQEMQAEIDKLKALEYYATKASFCKLTKTNLTQESYSQYTPLESDGVKWRGFMDRIEELTQEKDKKK